MSSGRHGYLISHVAEFLSCHPQTLRLYERMGLVRPQRSRGRQRRYTEEDLRSLRFIQLLTEQLGVNLAGVEVIMNMRGQIVELQQRLAQLQAELDSRLDSQVLEGVIEAEYWEVEKGPIMEEGTDASWQ